MRISTIPWEFIWLLSLFIFCLSVIWTVVGQIRRRRLGFPNSFFFYSSLLLLAIIPAGLYLTNYRFQLGPNQSESTLVDHELPDLVTRGYDQYPLQDVYAASLRAIQSARTYGQPWRITSAELTARKDAARIIVQVPVFFWLDELDITIQLKYGGEPGLWVLAFSQSLATKRDYGENARHIQQFYQALEAELATIGSEE